MKKIDGLVACICEGNAEHAILDILFENKYVEYQKYKSKTTPSEYCKKILKYKDVKSYDFVYGYFSDIDKLIKAIKTYKSNVKLDKNEWTLFDILKITSNN